MKCIVKALALAVSLGTAAGVAEAGVVLVNADINGSVTWTNDCTYNLQTQIFVNPGATLTIEAGTVVASTTGMGGSLAVAKGGQIFVQGTKACPVIFTSTADVATWDADASHPTGGDPYTGDWRASCLEWGNLTIMGCGYISENANPANVPTCNANNVAQMEGFVGGDARTLYGGGDDTDDSGCIEYLSIRYGGRVIAVNDELNGLSLGGVGSETDIHHVEIMNNVDDGIEIWGGCVSLSHFAIWNVGDDSFDVDQGWRGKAQFGLVVQGYSCNDGQGSGVGDNGFETDGAEDSDWQPVTTTTLYNMTFIGNPQDGDGATAWRDNARVQYRKCIFMDCGERVVRFDNVDGDGANGYGFNGTLSWADTWNTAWNAAPPHANDCPPGTYKAQCDGRLAEITDSVFFRNLNGSAYNEAIARDVFNPANNNVMEPAVMPIVSLARGPIVVVPPDNLLVEPVAKLDPRAAGDAVACASGVKNDGFFKQTSFRGAFDPSLPYTWLSNWSAGEAFGFLCEVPNLNVLVFDVLVGNNVVAQLTVCKIGANAWATLTRNCKIRCCDEPVALVNNNPLTGEFRCGPITFQIVKQGNSFTWSAANFSGTLRLVRC